MTDEELHMRMNANEVISVANGFSFVPDYAPAGLEDDFIPAEEFTAYFMRGQIPYASAGANRGHDFVHGPSYRELFHNQYFAQLIQASATVACSNRLEHYFTGSIDKFGDAHIILTQYYDDPERRYERVQDAKIYLSRLIRLRAGKTSNTKNEGLTAPEMRDFSNLWLSLGLAGIEHEAESELARENPDYLRSDY